eukprot:CAMPEP_0197283004 /NCGR_PEP_ID=MMETSP1432-20130617/24711_1 /TAXON_ID=44447 /ORGANISM="Pseudo-nitzschia delicatissima, Strain UNC1205" /LENGTH=337 /DNA_ID=CAMNT_0042749985 /DNA_START=146 /DNA_END=1160 /DNA_ORIENTATION=-
MRTLSNALMLIGVSCLLIILGANEIVADTDGSYQVVRKPNLRRSLETPVNLVGAVRSLHDEDDDDDDDDVDETEVPSGPKAKPATLSGNPGDLVGAVRSLHDEDEDEDDDDVDDDVDETETLENIEKEFSGEEEAEEKETEELEKIEEEFEGENTESTREEQPTEETETVDNAEEEEENETSVPEPVVTPTSPPVAAPTAKPALKPYQKDDGFDPVKAEDEKHAEEEELQELETELKQEEKVARQAGGLGLVFGILAMIFTAHQMSENPDGIYASVCRLAITISSVVVKIICMPCRKVLGVGGSGNPYSGHMPISTSDYSYRNDPYRSNANAGFEMS